MSMLKKLTSIVLSSVLCLSLCIPAFAAENKKEFLKERGFSENFLERRTDNQIEKLYNACLEENLKFDSTKVVTLKEELENNGTMPIGSIPEDDMSLEITPLVKVVTDSDLELDEVELVRVFVFYEWAKGKPWILKEDAISVNWDPTLFTFDNNFELSCCSDNKEYASKSRPDKSTQGGVGVFAELYATAGVLSGTCEFDLVPKTTPLYLAKRTDTGRIAHTMNVEYVHDKNIGTGGLSFVIKGVGISINKSGSYDEAATGTVSYFKY